MFFWGGEISLSILWCCDSDKTRVFFVFNFKRSKEMWLERWFSVFMQNLHRMSTTNGTNGKDF